MASAAFRNPITGTYRSLQRMAHEKPVIFYSLVIGFTGPVMVLTVPTIRKKYFGWKPAEKVPTTYPLPDRPRRPVTAYADA